jgi:AraC-like DNA-binding protein
MRDPFRSTFISAARRILIDRDFAEPLDVPALAREAYTSRAHFVRSFKKAFGETPHRYLQRRRVKRAKELLRNTRLTVTEVSLAVGFRSLGSFSTAFRQLVGESPLAYARRWRSADPPPIPACFTLMYTRPYVSTSRAAAWATPASVDLGLNDRRRKT